MTGSELWLLSAGNLSPMFFQDLTAIGRKLQALGLFVQAQQERFALGIAEVHVHAVGMRELAEPFEGFAPVFGLEGRIAVASAHPKNGGVFRIENNSAGAIFDFGAPKLLPNGAAVGSLPKSAFADPGNNSFSARNGCQVSDAIGSPFSPPTLLVTSTHSPAGAFNGNTAAKASVHAVDESTN